MTGQDQNVCDNGSYGHSVVCHTVEDENCVCMCVCENVRRERE